GCLSAYKDNKKILFAGNGGSAADAQHLAAELVARFYFNRPALAAIALTTDTSILTAVGNDFGFEDIFSRQVEALGNQGDVFIGISTSGNSPNILKAFSVANEKGLFTVALTGQSGGKMKDVVDLCIQVPSDETPRIQEAHILIGHSLCEYLEGQLFTKG
ncbi:MAG: D-sedoheptulose 7-phosphate isomerase, partial [SAR324 cluster bacterium]|nr:D-sedoheptulose 7-phosphate isomerase [SAR324 cluster bacterium]